MKASTLHLVTLRADPAHAEIASHRLMLRAGLIDQVASGIYDWLPLGLRVLRRVEEVVRQEMNAIGCAECLLPMVQPAELWETSGRWGAYGPELLRFTDRHQRGFCLGPTHEEVITDLARRTIKSRNQLPVTLYQIQTKFRDEIRPRFGVMRAREFLMKDAYSFHENAASLDKTYQDMAHAYQRIFQRLGLACRMVAADSGAIGGAISHEFHILADSGEDVIAYDPASSYAANLELAQASPAAHAVRELPHIVAARGHAGGAVALVLAAGDRLNATKAGKLSQLAQPLCLLDDQALSACGIVSITVDAPGWEAVIWDEEAAALAAGATILHTADLRTVQPGDPSPITGEPLQLARGIEVGHIFQLGTKYSTAMEAVITDEQGQGQPMLMGCYGIGISRIVAAAIEQCHDARGIAWPAAMAPFQVAIAPLRTGSQGDEAVMAEAQAIHDQLEAQGIACLLDDRGLRAGAMFSDLELIGIPWRVVVSTRLLEQDTLEYQGRHEPKATVKARHAVFQELLQHLA